MLVIRYKVINAVMVLNADFGLRNILPKAASASKSALLFFASFFCSKITGAGRIAFKRKGYCRVVTTFLVEVDIVIRMKFVRRFNVTSTCHFAAFLACRRRLKAAGVFSTGRSLLKEK